jgi:hypothetical protein
MIIYDTGMPRWITDDAFDASRVGNQMIILRGSESGEKIAGEKMFRLFLQLAAAKTAASQFGLKHFKIRQGQELTADDFLHFRLGVNAVPILHNLYRLPPLAVIRTTLVAFINKLQDTHS